jgi:hypothetical protein
MSSHTPLSPRPILSARVHRTRVLPLLWLCAAAAFSRSAASGEPIERHYVTAPASPMTQSPEMAASKSAGCLSCHTQTDNPTMHSNPAINLGCTDCHGGNQAVALASGVSRGSAEYRSTMDSAHVLPRYPSQWHYPSSANPQRSYTLLNREAPEFIRFMNPSDFRVVRESCGACHAEDHRGLRAQPACDQRDVLGRRLLQQRHSGLQELHPRGVLQPRGRRHVLLKGPLMKDPDASLRRRHPAAALSSARLGDDQAGRHLPHLRARRAQHRQSLSRDRPARCTGRAAAARGAGTPGHPRIQPRSRHGRAHRGAGHQHHQDAPQRSELWFMGTNDQPGDYRQSGCAACHVVYANDRDPRTPAFMRSSGHDGTTHDGRPDHRQDESGHPLKHASRAPFRPASA